MLKRIISSAITAISALSVVSVPAQANPYTAERKIYELAPYCHNQEIIQKAYESIRTWKKMESSYVPRDIQQIQWAFEDLARSNVERHYHEVYRCVHNVADLSRGQKGTVNINNGYLNVRDYDNNVIRRLYRNQTVEVTSTGNGWAEIRMSDGTIGYVQSQYLNIQ